MTDPSPHDPLRLALVGYGMAGRDIHAPLLRATDGLQVTHVVTANPQRAAAARQEFGEVTVVPTTADLWADAARDLDLVVLASPNYVHVVQARAAIEHGIATVVDKPLATNRADARGLVELAGKRGVPLTVFQNRRWDPEHLTARRLLEEGALGEVFRYEARYERFRPIPKDRWRENMSTDEGGGLLLDLQSHLVDGAIDLFGRVTSVYAELSALSTRGDDVTFLALGHASGVRSHLGATSLGGAPGPRTRMLGRAGAYFVPNVTDETSAYAEWADRSAEQRGWLVRGEEAEPVRREPGSWSDFYPVVVAMVRDGAPPPVDPHDAVAVLEVLDAARRSAHEGVLVHLG
ncbi:MAG: Gfo/Idh/MocA family protein [Actinomycetes bacterium]